MKEGLAILIFKNELAFICSHCYSPTAFMESKKLMAHDLYGAHMPLEQIAPIAELPLAEIKKLVEEIL